MIFEQCWENNGDSHWSQQILSLDQAQGSLASTEFCKMNTGTKKLRCIIIGAGSVTPVHVLLWRCCEQTTDQEQLVGKFG